MTSRLRHRFDVLHIVRPRHGDLVLPGGRVDGLHRLGRRREVGHAAVDGQGGLVDAAQFLGAGMHMHHLLRRHRQVEQRVAAGRRLAQARPDGDDEIAFLDPLAERRIDADAEVADEIGMAVVDQVLVPEGRGDRQVVGFGERPHVGAGFGGPAAASEDEEGLAGRRKKLAQRRHVRHRRGAARDAVGTRIGDLDLIG